MLDLNLSVLPHLPNSPYLALNDFHLFFILYKIFWMKKKSFDGDQLKTLGQNLLGLKAAENHLRGINKLTWPLLLRRMWHKASLLAGFNWF